MVCSEQTGPREFIGLLKPLSSQVCCLYLLHGFFFHAEVEKNCSTDYPKPFSSTLFGVLMWELHLGSLRPKCLVIFLLKTSPNKQTCKNACPCFGYSQQSQLSRVRSDRWSRGSPPWQAASPGSRTVSRWTCVSKRAENGWFSPTPASRTTCIILLGSLLMCNVILYPPVIHLIIKECWILPPLLCLKGA